MKRYVPAGPLRCQNCGGDVVDDGRSPTGVLHAATQRTRCDGRSVRESGTPSAHERAAVA